MRCLMAHDIGFGCPITVGSCIGFPILGLVIKVNSAIHSGDYGKRPFVQVYITLAIPALRFPVMCVFLAIMAVTGLATHAPTSTHST